MTYLSLGFLATFSKQLHSLSSFLDTFWYLLADFLGSGLFVYSHIYPGTCPKNVTNYLVSTYHVYHVYHVPYASYVTDVFAYSHICPGFRPKNVTNSSLSLSLSMTLARLPGATIPWKRIPCGAHARVVVVVVVPMRQCSSHGRPRSTK